MKMNELGPALTYTWISRDSTYNIKFILEADGIVVEAPNGKSFEPYTAIRGVQLTPAMTNFGPVTAIWLNRKQFGLAVTIAVRGPYPSADAGQVTAYNNWVKALHATLIERQLVDQITFRCGTHVNRWGWIASAYPALRVSALALVPIGIVAAIMTNSWAFAMTCIGGGAAMLMMPKIVKPDVPNDLRRVGPYSPDAIPEGCLATPR
ncbi:hypothetical protein ACNREE_08580 [Ralstonia pseudosolanacearum]|uniref:hypothetical protein n=1 Tax=Ralstonia pseudosolanacearum TaxID=1310165 RepID=UPI003AACA9C9